MNHHQPYGEEDAPGLAETGLDVERWIEGYVDADGLAEAADCFVAGLEGAGL